MQNEIIIKGAPVVEQGSLRGKRVSTPVAEQSSL